MSSSIEVANIALILGLIVVVIASIRWEAGIITSLIAATGLNYFCTEPIHSLRVTSGDDLLAITLLISLGPAIGRQISQLSLPRESTIVGIIRDQHVMPPHGETVLRESDEVLVLVTGHDGESAVRSALIG